MDEERDFVPESDLIENEPELDGVQDESDNDGEADTSPEKNGYIKKEVALQWKRDMKVLKRELSQLKEKEVTEDLKSKITNVKVKAIQNGFGEDFAEYMGEVVSDLMNAVKRDDPVSDEVTEELEDLAEEYPDILNHKKEIVDKVKKYRKVDPDFSIADAIKLLGDKTKSKKTKREIELEVEQRNLLARRNTERQPSSNGGGAVKETYPLSQDDLRILKQMQSEHPDSAWTKKKYYDLLIKNKRR